MRTLFTTVAAPLFVGLLWAPDHAEAQRRPPPGLTQPHFACTPVTSVPITIAESGVYCLTGPLDYPELLGAAIVIDASSVVLDLNGFGLGGFAGPTTEAVGITSSARADITVRNGTVEGFKFGIDLRGVRHLVEDIHATRNLEGGIQVLGNRHVVRNNRVMFIRGSSEFAWGTYADGRGIVIQDNDVSGVRGPDADTSVAILLSNFEFGGTNFLVVNNRITQTARGIVFPDLPARGKYRDNLTSGVSIPFQGGTDAGNNN